MLILLHMNKTLPTLGNEKEHLQIKFYEKLSGELIFLPQTKNRKMFLVKKVTPLYLHITKR